MLIQVRCTSPAGDVLIQVEDMKKKGGTKYVVVRCRLAEMQPGMKPSTLSAWEGTIGHVSVKAAHFKNMKAKEQPE